MIELALCLRHNIHTPIHIKPYYPKLAAHRAWQGGGGISKSMLPTSAQHFAMHACRDE